VKVVNTTVYFRYGNVPFLWDDDLLVGNNLLVGYLSGFILPYLVVNFGYGDVDEGEDEDEEMDEEMAANDEPTVVTDYIIVSPDEEMVSDSYLLYTLSRRPRQKNRPAPRLFEDAL
jgi:hypothetical protein